MRVAGMTIEALERVLITRGTSEEMAEYVEEMIRRRTVVTFEAHMMALAA